MVADHYQNGMAKTTISVSDETKQSLKELGSKGDTYDDIVSHLIKESQQRAIGENDQ